jgi:hypothetical protein
MAENLDEKLEKKFDRAMLIVDGLAPGRSIDDQTLMLEATATAGHFEAQDATVLHRRLKERNDVTVYDVDEEGMGKNNVYFFIMKHR